MHYFKGTAYMVSLAFVLALCGGRAVARQAEYKSADKNFYLRAALLKAHPSAVIIGSDEYRHVGDSYFVEARHQPAPEIYVEVTRDWLEPITPPSMPESLGLAPDVMQIREPQGDVQVAPPENPTAFVPATEGMPISNGAVVKTGENGTAAVLFGGVDSARLVPDSEAMVQQTVTPELRSTRVDLKSGAVFSKVGMRPGEKQDYEVHTPSGVALAKGTDFVCVTVPDRTDVWVVQGTVRFDQPNGQTAGTARSTGKGAPKLIRFPAIRDAARAEEATSQTLTEVLNFIPVVNVNLKTLHDQMTQGVKLTPQESRYLTFMRHVTSLQRLTLVAPPAPAPMAPAIAAVPAPMLSAQHQTLLAVPAPSAPAPYVDAHAGAPAEKALPVELVIDVQSDGSIHFQEAQLSSGALERRLAKIAHAAPDCPVTIRGDKSTEGDRIRTVLAMCHEAHLRNITFAPLPEGQSESQPLISTTPSLSNSPKAASPQ